MEKTAVKQENRKKHEPLIHIVKRDTLPWYQSWGIRAASIVAALIISAVVTMLLTGENPLMVYKTMFQGAFGSERRIWNLLQSLAMLLCVSLAVTPAFKMRFWNIGAEGQVLVGGLATAASPAKTVEIAKNGFNVLSSSSLYNGNNPMYTFKYIALR